jgi:hypothetical protein
MKEIKITITIPESEYQIWNCAEHGVEGVKRDLVNIIGKCVKMERIELFTIEVEDINN